MTRWHLLFAVVAVAAICVLAALRGLWRIRNRRRGRPTFRIFHIICKALGKCKDPVPRVGPKQACTPANDGAVEIVWDNRLEVYVTWECRCGPDPGCHWYRQDITHSKGLPWAPPHKRVVMDAMRACKSIVCKKVWVPHFYPTQWIFGKRWCGDAGASPPSDRRRKGADQGARRPETTEKAPPRPRRPTAAVL